MNATELAIAYSPESPILDDVIRAAVTNLLVQNFKDLLPIFKEKIKENYTFVPPVDFPIIELPPDFDLNSTIIDFIKSRVKIVPYKNSTDLRGIYIDEETTRKVIAAVEFDDKLYGKYQTSFLLFFLCLHQFAFLYQCQCLLICFRSPAIVK